MHVFQRSMVRNCANPDVRQIQYGVTQVTHRKILKKRGANTAFGIKNPGQDITNESIKTLKKE